MADVTVTKLAESIRTPIDKLLTQLASAGVEGKTADDTISISEKSALLAYLKKSHGKGGKLSTKSGSKLSLKAKEKSDSETPEKSKKTLSMKKPIESEPAKKVAPVPTSNKPIINRKETIAEKRARKEAENKAFEEKRKSAINNIKAEQEAKKERKLAAENAKVEEAKVKESKTKQFTKVAKPAESTDYKKKTDKEQNIEDLLNANKNKKKKKKVVRSEDDFKDKIYTQKDADTADHLLSKRKTIYKKKLKLKNVHGFAKPTTVGKKKVRIFEDNKVGDIALDMSLKATAVIKELFKMGVMATINETIDKDTATLVCEELGFEYEYVSITTIEDEIHHNANVKDRGDLSIRPPVVTVMGHVDHGKTSLLDYIRKSQVTDGEAGGITQHIGSYHVETDHGMITFLDTPGHAAFSAMRARGAKATDIVILVVAADDGVMPQTEEAIQHAKAANVPIIVAVNKIDKEGANPEKVKKELSNHNVIPEDWGGETIFIDVSAKEGTGITELLEAISLQADVMELQGAAQGYANGIVIESRLEKGRGTIASILVQNGVLKKGDIVLVGTEYGRVRAMLDENGKTIVEAGPSIPLEVLGLSGTPTAGDDFLVMATDKKAREAAESRQDAIKLAASDAKKAVSMEDFFSRADDAKMTSLNIVLKTDVQGSFEAIKDALTAIVTDEVKVNIVGGGVGGIRETDVSLAQAAGAIMVGFNVRADGKSKRMIQDNNIDLKYYSIIYNLIDDVKDAVSGLLSPEIRETIIGMAEVKDVFFSPKLGAIAGCMVMEGVVKMSAPIRVLREEVVVYEGELESLRRFKDEVKDVRMGTECGIGVKNYNDIKAGDQIEVFERTEFKRTVD